MFEDITPPSSEAPRHGVQGEPEPGVGQPHETPGEPPSLIPVTMPPLFAPIPWKPPSRASRMLSTGITLTIRFAPTMIFIWMVGPEELKYQVRKQARWLPYAARYAAWWLRQEGF